MSDGQIANVVRTLTEGLTPVAPLPPVRTRSRRWAVLCAAIVAAAALMFGFRRDLPVALLSTSMLAQLAAMSAVAALSAMAALRLAVPGADRSTGRLLAIGALVAWPDSLLVASQVSGIDIATLMAEPWHPSCGRTIALSSLAPAIAIAWMMRGGVVLERRWAAVMAGIAASAVGAIAVAFTCPLGNVPHLFMAHALPTVGIAAALATISLWLIRQPHSRVIAALVMATALLASTSASAQEAQAKPLPPFTVAASATGYVSTEPFLEFLRKPGTQQQQAPPSDGRRALLTGGALLVAGALLIILGRRRSAQRNSSAWIAHATAGLGVCSLLAAVYVGYESFAPRSPQRVTTSASADGWHHSLEEGLAEAKASGKPVFLDVWATWCKNCGVMEATTFKDPQVRTALDSYVKVRFQAEDVERPDVSELLDRLDSVGLPTYAVLQPPTP